MLRRDNSLVDFGGSLGSTGRLPSESSEVPGPDLSRISSFGNGLFHGRVVVTH